MIGTPLSSLFLLSYSRFVRLPLGPRVPDEGDKMARAPGGERVIKGAAAAAAAATAARITSACGRVAEPVKDKQIRWSSTEMGPADVSTVCFDK